MEITSYVLSFRMVFSYLVTTGWIFDISLLCNDSTNQPISLESDIRAFGIHSGGLEGDGT